MGNAGRVNYSAGKSAGSAWPRPWPKVMGAGFRSTSTRFAFGFVRTRLTAAKKATPKTIKGADGRNQLGIPGADAGHGLDDHPAAVARPHRSGRTGLFSARTSPTTFGQVLNVTSGQFGGMYT